MRKRFAVWLSVLLWCGAMGLVGCGPSQEHEQLLYIESIIDHHADSALMLFNEIPYERLRSEGDRALYGMLQAQVSDKNWIVLDDDSLAFAAARYFADKNDRKRCLIATYYGGRIQYSNGDYTAALTTFLQSKELAEELGEPFWVGMSCRGISDVYHESYNIADELVYAQEEYRYIQMSGRQPYINYALLDLARAYCSSQDYEKSREVIRQVVDSATLYQDSYLYCEAKRLEGIGCMAEDEEDKVLQIFEMICQAGMGTTRDSAYLSMAYIEKGELSKAEDILTLIPHEEKLFLNFIRYKAFKKQGKIRDALYEMERIDTLSNDKFIERINQTLNSTIVSFYDLEEAKTDAELSATKMRMWLIVVVALVVIAFIILVTWHFIARQRKQIAEKVLLAEQLQELLVKGEAEKSHSVSMMKELLASRYNLLEEFCNIVTCYPDSKTTQRKVAESVTTLIESLSVNSERIVSLEQEVDALYNNLMTDFKRDLPHLKDADYRLFLYTILGLSNTAILLFLKEDKMSAVYDRKRRLKDKIKKLDSASCERYMQFFS